MTEWLKKLDRNLPGARFALRAMCVVGAMGIGLAGSAAGQVAVDPPSDVCTPRFLSQSVVVGRYIFKAYRDSQTGGACLVVEEEQERKEKLIGKVADKLTHKDEGRVVFRRTMESFGQYVLGQPAQPKENIAKIENGTDITGRGRPDMIVTNWTGGEHCCLSHYVFELEPRLRLLAEIQDADGDRAHFAAMDGHRGYYYLGNDWTFAYWNASFADTPAPTVVLHYVDDGRRGGYHLAMEKMQRPEPSREAWNRAIEKARGAFARPSEFGDGVGSPLWSDMLHLIYTDHADLAWKLYDQAWPAQMPGKEKFLSGFCSQLMTSPYWPDLAGTIQSAPPECAGARAEASGQ
jgi:hypothetical protein